MGLLDAIFSNPAATAALGQGLLAGNLGAGTAGFFGAIEAQKEKALKSKLLESQIQENAAQAAFRQAEAQKQLAAITEQQRINQVLQNAGKPKPGGGPTNLINDALGGFGVGAQPALKSPAIDYQELIRQNVPIERVKALAEARNYGRDEIARTIDTVDAQGRPITRQYTKFGDPVGGDALQWKAPVTVNQGNQTTFVDPVSMRNLGGLRTFQSPDSAASVAATIRGQDMNDRRQRDANEIAQFGKVADASTAIRKEFEGLPEVKNYKQALPSYKSIEDAVKRNTPQSDINIVYGLAKLYDPTSVVREGEYATVANSPNIPERIKGYAQYLAGGGKLSPVTKAQILAEAQGRIKSYEDQYSSARNDFESISQRSGADKSLIFPKPMTPAVDPNALPPVPMKGMTRGGYRFKGGDPGDKNNWEKL